MDDAGDRGAVLGAHDEHVAAVAIGDDLLLQVLRRVLAAEVGLQRVPRSLDRCFRRRSRMLLSSGLASSTTSPAGSILRRMSAISGSKVAAVVAIARRIGYVPRARRTAAAGCFDRGEEVGERQELARIEGAALDRQRCQGRVQVVRRAESDRGFRQETNGLGRRIQRRRDLARLDERRQARQPGQTGRRLREAADRFDDAIEFEGPEGAGVHER